MCRFFFFYDTATPEIYTLSLHDALPILKVFSRPAPTFTTPSPRGKIQPYPAMIPPVGSSHRDRKSTRLNSSHRCISYAVFCLKKKNNLFNWQKEEVIKVNSVSSLFDLNI